MFAPTNEQLVAIDLVKNNGYVKLSAFAGCTKTTTLTMVADELALPSLYLAFNKAMATEASGKFPDWVTVKTTHSLAYGYFGRDIAHKLKRPQGGYVNVCGTGAEIARYFRINDFYYVDATGARERVTAAGIGMSIRETVNAFEYSDDERIEFKHVSWTALRDRVLPKKDFADYLKYVLDTARKLWKLRVNPASDILATHDTYLKLFQLAKPDLSKYQIIYLDEAQDTNDCVLDIIRRQPCKIVVVGDKYQQIYQFRGSVNAMAKLPYTEGTLTQSFRFGDAIAGVANMILSVDSTQTNLVGTPSIKSVIATGEPVEQSVILYRTNMTLILDAVDMIANGERVNLEIDVRDFIKLIESANALKAGKTHEVKHEELLVYSSWSEFADEVSESSSNLGRVYKIIEDKSYPKVVAALTNHRNTDEYDKLLTTAHKSKGREFDVVKLANDYPTPYNDKGEWIGLSDMERNLLYVAATRAKQKLYVNSTISDIARKVNVNLGLAATVSTLDSMSDDEVAVAFAKIVSGFTKVKI